MTSDRSELPALNYIITEPHGLKPTLVSNDQIILKSSRGLILDPKQTIEHSFGVKFQLGEHCVGLILGGKVIFSDFSIRITPRL
jgi:hypothetical protein